MFQYALKGNYSSMRYLKYSQPAVSLGMNKMLHRLQLPAAVKNLMPMDIVCIVLPLCALILWSISLKSVDVQQMNDLGLVSVLPVSIIVALIIMMVSFCLALHRSQIRTPILLLHLVLLVFMLYGITVFVEEVPNFGVVYRHTGYVEYIMRTGTVAPTLDTYFNWPSFFILSAFVTKVAGYQSDLSFIVWASVFFNLIFLVPIYVIFTSATTDKRLIWLGLWFFALTNWIEQDSFLPQSLNFFLYLVIIAILLKWFKATPKVRIFRRKLIASRLGRFSRLSTRLYEWYTVPDTLHTKSSSRQRVALIIILIAIFALSVSSHPLTPFFVLVSVAVLMIFRRCTPLWLAILMAIMNAAWIFFMARAFLAGHTSMVTGDFFHLGSAITSNVTSRAAQGSVEHTFVARIRIVMTLVIWGLAFLGGVRRWRAGYHDLTYILLIIPLFPILVIQQYGGEMLLRIYLFTLPPMVFFAAAFFYTPSTGRASSGKFSWATAAIGRASSSKFSWATVAIAGVSIMLLCGFLFTRYGNERADYKTQAELTGVHYLYSKAPPRSLLLEAWDGTPWMFQDYEKYDTDTLSTLLSSSKQVSEVGNVIQFIKTQQNPSTYLIITRSQKATADQAGMPAWNAR